MSALTFTPSFMCEQHATGHRPRTCARVHRDGRTLDAQLMHTLQIITTFDARVKIMSTSHCACAMVPESREHRGACP